MYSNVHSTEHIVSIHIFSGLNPYTVLKLIKTYY